MKNRPILTIGIPTYNFGHVIGETLSSITAQLPDNVEILIVDGGSCDSTEVVVRAWADEFSSIVYHRKETRDGIDVDMALVVELARADYCWLMSADDLIEQGAVQSVLGYIANEPDLVLLSHSNCDATMNIIQRRHPVLSGQTRVIELIDDHSRARYFKDALTSEALFSFISGLVVRRSTWNVDRETGDLMYGSCWAHATRLLHRMRHHGMNIVFVREPLVRRRGENDSFADGGIVSRYTLAIDGYISLVDNIFGRDDTAYWETLRILRTEFTILMFMYAKKATVSKPDREDVRELTRLFNKIYPNSIKFGLVRLAFKFPAATFISVFEALNTFRHYALRRAA